jgi:hypothetical protein
MNSVINYLGRQKIRVSVVRFGPWPLPTPSRSRPYDTPGWDAKILADYCVRAGPHKYMPNSGKHIELGRNSWLEE